MFDTTPKTVGELRKLIEGLDDDVPLGGMLSDSRSQCWPLSAEVIPVREPRDYNYDPVLALAGGKNLAHPDDVELPGTEHWLVFAVADLPEDAEKRRLVRERARLAHNLARINGEKSG